MANFPFTDLHSFKDYIGFVQLYLPDRFPVREGVTADEQWSMSLAFEGLRYGLRQALEEKGEKPVFAQSQALVEEAYNHYKEGRLREGFSKLDEMTKLLKKVRTR
jgi:hypothetical protein